MKLKLKALVEMLGKEFESGAVPDDSRAIYLLGYTLGLLDQMMEEL